MSGCGRQSVDITKQNNVIKEGVYRDPSSIVYSEPSVYNNHLSCITTFNGQAWLNECVPLQEIVYSELVSMT